MKTTPDYEAAQILLMQDIPVSDPEAPIDLTSMASDLRALVTNPLNKRLSEDFKGSVNAYSGAPDDAHEFLLERRRLSEDETTKWQSLVAVLPRPENEAITPVQRPLIVVGLGAVTTRVAIAPSRLDIDPEWPNVSLFVDAEHRRHHIADRLVSRAHEVIGDIHKKIGWSAVQPHNVASRYLLEKHGYSFVGHQKIAGVPKDHFVHDGRAESIS